jgi:hypothetical protein
MGLGAAERNVLAALVSGYRLQSHRSLDGEKRYALHADGHPDQPVSAPVVERLRDRGLIESNMKFPAATYLLTVRGEQVAASLVDSPLRPLTSRRPPAP